METYCEYDGCYSEAPTEWCNKIDYYKPLYTANKRDYCETHYHVVVARNLLIKKLSAALALTAKNCGLEVERIEDMYRLKLCFYEPAHKDELKKKNFDPLYYLKHGWNANEVIALRVDITEAATKQKPSAEIWASLSKQSFDLGKRYSSPTLASKGISELLNSQTLFELNLL